jgi:histidinol dehydrogenase
MRTLQLNARSERKLLEGRRRSDPEALRAAGRIVADVRRRGERALVEWTERLDGVRASAKAMKVSAAEMRAAEREAQPELLRAIKQAARNIRRVAREQMPERWSIEPQAGVRVGQLVRPIERIGCYVPGGGAALVSTLLMTAVPAQVAGVEEIVVCCPRPSVNVLAAASLLGLREVYRAGGAQAIAALAYGTRTIRAVEKIFGPGNRYVTAAKQMVSADCAIDLPAGPTEAVVYAEDGNARWIAADLLAQAEHAADAVSILVTTSAQLGRAVEKELREQCARLPEGSPAGRSLAKTGAIVIAASRAAAMGFINRFAPEHLSLAGRAKEALEEVRSAGTVFLGDYSAQPFGDYVSGSNHVLPTAGWARSRAGLSVRDFVKCISVQEITRAGARRLGPAAMELARAEGLTAHEQAVKVRL